MNKYFTSFIFTIFIVQISCSQIKYDSLKYLSLAAEGRILFKEGNFQKSYEKYLEAISIKNVKPWKNDLIGITKSSIYCNCGNPIKFLRLELKLYDFFDPLIFESDTLFRERLKEKKFVKILKNNSKNIEIAKNEIPEESIFILENIYLQDQKDRENWNNIEKENGRNSKEYSDMIAKVMRNDSMRVFKVLDFVKNNKGIPRDEILTKKASSGIFLAIQHSAFPIQQLFYPYILKSLDYGGFRLSEFALFDDRFRLRQNLRQLYGTQVARSGNGYFLQEIEDPKGLHQRRKIMGLPPINDYLKKWNIAYEEPKD